MSASGGNRWTKHVCVAMMRRMSFRGGGGRGSTTPEGERPLCTEGVVKTGYLRKIKTGKRKWFVLRSGGGEDENSQARLEYFDNEKRWKAGAEPKRSINIRCCFNINKKHDTKHRIVVALYTPRDCFALQCGSVEEQDEWLCALLTLQQEGSMPEDHKPRPNFDHIWEVAIKSRSLALQKNLQGDHRLCLTARTLSLVRMEGGRNAENYHSPPPPSSMDFPLNSIRRCGHTDCFFFMEMGRSSVTGAGELWMQTDDTVIAQNMHEVILSAMKSSKSTEDTLRPRSSSTSENSKPISIHPTPLMPAPLGSSPANLSSSMPLTPRERCDSLPARSRQTSESFDHTAPAVRCNTMDGTHPVQQHSRPWSASTSTSGGNMSPLCQMHTHSSLESCSDDLNPPPHQQQIVLSRNHLHLNVMAPMDCPTQETIAEVEEGTSDYLAMNSPVQPDGGSLIPSPVTMTDGPSSLSGHYPYFLPHQLSSTSSNEYMKMSPTHDTSSNSNNNNADSSYMSMSPVGSSVASINLLNGALPNGYVPMEPMGNSAPIVMASSNCNTGTGPGGRHPESSPLSPSGYMDMAPLSSSLPKSVGGFSGSWGSSIHSLHESSPTFDLNLEGFHLEKVKSFFSSNEDQNTALRTGRSFSVGKRPTVGDRYPPNERVRAYSVGSQVSSVAALAARRRQQQGDILGTPTSERGRTNSYSKRSSSTTTLGGGSRHSEEFMEINYDENWHRATSVASTPPTSLNNNNSDYLPMMRILNKDTDSMKLFPVKEVDVVPSPKDTSDYVGHSPVNRNSAMCPPQAVDTLRSDTGAKNTSEYMDVSVGGGHDSAKTTSRPQTLSGDGEYVSLDMNKPWQLRVNNASDAPQAKKSKPTLVATTSLGSPTTVSQHDYENLSFGANGATSTMASSAQEPMQTLESKISMPPPASPMLPLHSSQTAAVNINGVLGSSGCHELNYASLDLPSAAASEECPSPRSQLTPAMELSDPTGVSYSEVDFRKSEGLRSTVLGGRV